MSNDIKNQDLTRPEYVDGLIRHARDVFIDNLEMYGEMSKEEVVYEFVVSLRSFLKKRGVSENGVVGTIPDFGKMKPGELIDRILELKNAEKVIIHGQVELGKEEIKEVLSGSLCATSGMMVAPFDLLYNKEIDIQ